LIGAILVVAAACGSDPVASPQPEAQAVSGASGQSMDTQSGAPSQGGAMTTMAQDSAADAMAKDAAAMDAMTKDATTKDGVAMDTMTKDGSSINVMDKDSGARDAMAKDAMIKDGVAMDATTKDGSSMTTMAKDAMTKDGSAMDKKVMDGDSMALEQGKLTIELSGVQPLANGFHYEGWAILNGVPVSTGKFNVGADGVLIDLTGEPIPGGVFHTDLSLASASAIIVTIEPAGDADSIPAETHYLAGELSGAVGGLSVGHQSALGSDFMEASGVYILATPTDGPDTNETSGIWFLDLSSGSPEAGLDLPPLPVGWTYEGWTVIDGMAISTGRFSAAGPADLSAVYSGPEGGPPFPGEDFLINAPDGLDFPVELGGAIAVISVEPSPDDATAPFTLKPLIGEIPVEAKDHVNYPLDNNSQGFPSGKASVS